MNIRIYHCFGYGLNAHPLTPKSHVEILTPNVMVLRAGAFRPWQVWLSGLNVGCEPKGRGFLSQSGHRSGLQARSPVGGVREATTH